MKRRKLQTVITACLTVRNEAVILSNRHPPRILGEGRISGGASASGKMLMPVSRPFLESSPGKRRAGNSRGSPTLSRTARMRGEGPEGWAPPPPQLFPSGRATRGCWEAAASPRGVSFLSPHSSLGGAACFFPRAGRRCSPRSDTKPPCEGGEERPPGRGKGKRRRGRRRRWLSQGEACQEDVRREGGFPGRVLISVMAEEEEEAGLGLPAWHLSFLPAPQIFRRPSPWGGVASAWTAVPLSRCRVPSPSPP